MEEEKDKDAEFVTFQGLQVVSILDGSELRDEDNNVTKYLCTMSDNSQRYVPAELFEGRLLFK